MPYSMCSKEQTEGRNETGNRSNHVYGMAPLRMRVETICDDWRACVAFVIALIVAILAAVTVLAKYNDK